MSIALSASCGILVLIAINKETFQMIFIKHVLGQYHYLLWFLVISPCVHVTYNLSIPSLQRTIIKRYTVISEGNNNVIGSYNVSLLSIPSECSVISCLYSDSVNKLQIPTCTPLMSQGTAIHAESPYYV